MSENASGSEHNDEDILMAMERGRSSNLQGLLRFAMEAAPRIAPRQSNFPPMMDTERRNFLQGALASITIDVTDHLRKNINELNKPAVMNAITPETQVPEEVKTALDNLMDYCEDLDIAGDFYKIGGFEVFTVCLGCENEEVRNSTYWLMGIVCQNNPFCQAKFFEHGFYYKILDLLKTEKRNVMAKCIYALSCATRNFEPAYKELVNRGGCESLVAALKYEDLNTRTKLAYFIQHLCREHLEAQEKFVNIGLGFTLIELIKAKYDDSTQHLLAALAGFFSGLSDAVLQPYKDPAVGLKAYLQGDFEDAMFLPNMSDEMQLRSELLNQLFRTGETCEEVVDR